MFAIVMDMSESRGSSIL